MLSYTNQCKIMVALRNKCANQRDKMMNNYHTMLLLATPARAVAAEGI